MARSALTLLPIALYLTPITKVPLRYNLRNLQNRWKTTLVTALAFTLVIGLLTRPAAFVAFLYLGSLWVSEWGTAWIWELLVPVLASLGLAIGRAGRTWGIDGWLARRWPNAPRWFV